jgi:hypothetical protein
MPKLNMPKLNLSGLLKNKIVLYVIAFLSATNVLSYLIAGTYDAIVFFMLIGYLTTYFSKNMIIVLLTAMLTTNFLVASRYVGRKQKEAMENKEKNDNDKKNGNGNGNGDEDEDENDEDREERRRREEQRQRDEERRRRDEDKKESFDDFSSTLGVGGMSDISKNADEMDRLLKSFEKITPTIDKANQLINKVKPMQEGLEGVIGKLTSMASNFNQTNPPAQENK